jgi:Fur family ferric uptake transcriptional regulator
MSASRRGSPATPTSTAPHASSERPPVSAAPANTPQGHSHGHAHSHAPKPLAPLSTSERNTKQRAVIREVLEVADRPLSPPEIYEAAKSRHKGLGMATVYRAVKSLVDEGWLITVELPGESARYELAGKAHHHHFTCRTCRRVFEIHGCPGELSHLLPAGFRLETHDVVLGGLCIDCVKSA